MKMPLQLARSSVRRAMKLTPCTSPVSVLATFYSSAAVTNFPFDHAGGDLKTFHPGMRVWVQKATRKVNVDRNGVILKGYDPVAYFTQNKAVKGSSKYQSSGRKVFDRVSRSLADRDDDTEGAATKPVCCAAGIDSSRQLTVHGPRSQHPT
jgi:hypothetical protein